LNSEGVLAVAAWSKCLSLLRNFIKESEKNVTKIIVVFPEIGLFRPADEGTTTLRNVGKYSLKKFFATSQNTWILGNTAVTY